MNTESTSLGILYVQPVCFPAESDTAETLVLHFEWQTSQRSTASAQDTTADSSRAAVFQEPAVGGQPWPPADSCKGHPRSSSTHGSRQDGVPQPVLQGMLFHGSQCLAQYSWPLPGPQEAAQVVTAVAALPVMVQPCVLELVLACPTVAEAAATTSRRPSGSRSGRSSAASPPPSVARCPIVFLPPAAVQEVQQQLLPAMQQEVLEAWAATAAGAAAKGRPGGMPVPLLQAAVWQHWQALADDLGLVLGLVQGVVLQSTNAQLRKVQRRQQQMTRVVRQKVLPDVLEFLSRQGLQQVAAVVQLAAAASAVPRLSASPRPSLSAAAVGATAGVWAEPAGHLARHSGAAVHSARRPPRCPNLMQCQTVDSAATSGVAEDVPTTTTNSSSSSQLQVGCGVGAVGQDGGGSGDSSSSSSSSSSHKTDPTLPQQHAHHDQEGILDRSLPRHSLPQLTAAACWGGFPSPLEQQYVQYKHQRFIWLDRHAAGFTLLWICVLLVRMVWERDPQGIIMYLGYLLGKVAPYTLLVSSSTLGTYQRHREVLLSLVSQALCLAPIVVGALLVDPTITLPLIQGWSGALAWCQQQGGRLLQWWALLLAHWPQLAVVGQLPGAQQLAAATAAATAAIRSSPAVLLQLHQHLAAAIKVPESPMRSFWRIYGEYQVLVPMAIPRHVRLWYFVPSMLAEVAGNCYVFSWVFPWWQVVLRFTPALLLTIALAWWFDWWVRGKFVGHLRQLEEQQARQLAEKLQGLKGDE